MPNNNKANIARIVDSLFAGINKNIEKYGTLAIYTYLQSPLNIAANITRFMEESKMPQDYKKMVYAEIYKHLENQNTAWQSAKHLWGKVAPEEFFEICLNNLESAPSDMVLDNKDAHDLSH